MRKLSIYITPGHSSIEFTNGVSKTTSGPDIRNVIDSLPPEAANALLVFCHAVINHVDTMQHETPVRPDASYEKLLGL